MKHDRPHPPTPLAEMESRATLAAVNYFIQQASSEKILKANQSGRSLPFDFIRRGACLALMIFIFPQLSTAAGTENSDASSTVSSAALAQAIKVGGEYLENSCGPLGQFVYQVNVVSGRTAGEYNIVRHAGAMYALGMLNDLHPDQNAVAALTRSGNFMRYSIGPVGRQTGKKPMLVVWSNTPGGPVAPEGSLGATGLGLTGMVALKRVDAKSFSEPALQAMARFLISLQKEDGSFFNGYSVESGPSSEAQVLYYPGEASLGLLSRVRTVAASWVLMTMQSQKSHRPVGPYFAMAWPNS